MENIIKEKTMYFALRMNVQASYSQLPHFSNSPFIIHHLDKPFIYHSQFTICEASDPADEFHSPYVYCANNPVMLVDPDGCENEASDNSTLTSPIDLNLKLNFLNAVNKLDKKNSNGIGIDEGNAMVNTCTGIMREGIKLANKVPGCETIAKALDLTILGTQYLTVCAISDGASKESQEATKKAFLNGVGSIGVGELAALGAGVAFSESALITVSASVAVSYMYDKFAAPAVNKRIDQYYINKKINRYYKSKSYK